MLNFEGNLHSAATFGMLVAEGGSDPRHPSRPHHPLAHRQPRAREKKKCKRQITERKKERSQKKKKKSRLSRIYTHTHTLNFFFFFLSQIFFIFSIYFFSLYTLCDALDAAFLDPSKIVTRVNTLTKVNSLLRPLFFFYIFFYALKDFFSCSFNLDIS